MIPLTRQRQPAKGASSNGISVLRDSAGGFTLDAAMLAKRFGWSPEELRDMMRRGHVTSRVERGEGDDLGRWRLSVHCGNRRWQAVIETDGTIANENVDFIPPRKQPSDE